MKKFSLILTMILCIFTFSFTLSACEEEKTEFWLETNKKFDEFLTAEIQDKNYDNGFDFSQIQTYFDQNVELYGQIEEVYQSIWKVQISYLKKYSGLLKVTPRDLSNKAKTDFKNFENKIDSFKDELNTFTSNQLTTFIRNISNHTDSSDLIVKNDVRSFTRHYINLSSSLLELTNNLTNIYTSYYEDIKQLKTNDTLVDLNSIELETYTRIATTKSMTNTLACFIEYINNYNGEYEQLSTDNFLSTINYYNEISTQSHKATTQDLYNWQNIYNVYICEQENFLTALNNVSMEKFKTKSGYDIEKYAEDFENPNLIGYINKVLYFSENAVTALKNVSYSLYN